MNDKAATALVVYFYDEKHQKNYICGTSKRTFIDLNPKHALEVNHRQAISLLAKHGQKLGGGFENHATAYSDYVVKYQVPLDQI